MGMKRNYYVALRFKGRPRLHLTLRYFKSLTEEALAELVKRVGVVMTKGFQTDGFTIQFSKEAWFGPKNTVRVLLPDPEGTWPQWLTLLTQMTGGDSSYDWSPHVTPTGDSKSLTVTAVAVSVMHKQEEVARWELS